MMQSTTSSYQDEQERDYEKELEKYRIRKKEQLDSATRTVVTEESSADEESEDCEASECSKKVAGKNTLGNVMNSRNTMHVFKVGTKTAIGAGVGVLTGIFGAIAAASLLEVVVPALLITKVAGVVGGATGMIKGIRDAEKAEIV
ncbi:MAG: hypothetical protein HQK53_01405 [Oligoflexia bacterium]|nr:hypothetical protein [Oligoflexia bacterium]